MGERPAPVLVRNAVRVFAGNRTDAQTVPEQIRILANSFGVKKVTLVGDRGMLNQPQWEQFPETFHYITAITKAQIQKLVKQNVLQMGLVDQSIAEVQAGKVRYIWRRNPEPAQQMAHSRQQKLAVVRRLIQQQNG